VVALDAASRWFIQQHTQTTLVVQSLWEFHFSYCSLKNMTLESLFLAVALSSISNYWSR